MRINDKQSGITIWGLAVVAAVAAFFILLFFKLAPAYIDNMKVKTAVDNIASQPNAATLTKDDITNGLERRFEIDDVDNVDPKKDLHVDRSGTNGAMVIRVAYEVRVPLAYNITALIDFNNVAQVAAK
ncbi:MAG: DUF4845 domain-containing protein [Acidiferrobacterales bacterium]